MRSAEINRKTNETDIQLSLTIDGEGTTDVDTGCGFLNHMLTLFAFHGRFDLMIRCTGDTDVDDHHTVEDIGIALGLAFDKALSDRAGIARYGNFYLPMDEALVLCALDISGRAALNFDVRIPTEKIGTFDTELLEEFFLGFTRSLRATVHLVQMAGSNSHHIAEAAFKGFGRAMKMACTIEQGGIIPSSKGVL